MQVLWAQREKDPLETGMRGGKAGEEGRTPTSIANKNRNWPLAFKTKTKTSVLSKEMTIRVAF